MNKRFTRLVIAVFFIQFTYGSFFSLIRPLIRDLRGDNLTLLLADSIPSMIGLLSYFWGWLSDRFGRRILIALSMLGAFAIIMLSSADRPIDVVVSASIFALFNSMISIALLVEFSFEKSMETAFGSYAGFGAAGWGMGSLLMGIISDVPGLGVHATLIISSISWVMGCVTAITALGSMNPEKIIPMEGDELHENCMEYVDLNNRKTLPHIFLLSVFFTFLGLEVVYAIGSVKLYETLGLSKFAYGIVWGFLPSMMSLIVSKHAGIFVKKYGALKVFRVSQILYVLLAIIYSIGPDMLIPLTWPIPIYPFFSVSMNVIVSRGSHRKLRGSAMGALNSSIALAIGFSSIGGYLGDLLGRDTLMLLSTIPLMIGLLTTLAVSE